MNTLISLSVYPLGAGENLSAHVAEIIKVIQSAGLAHRTTAMSTELEGEWDDVMRVVKDAAFVLAEKGLRTCVNFRADIRPGRTNTITSKVEKLNSLLNEEICGAD